MDKFAGLCQVSTLLSSSSDKLHPFIFTSQATSVPGHVTTLTESREARIDAILYSSHLLTSSALDLPFELEAAKQQVAPNAIIPSDHFPLLTRMSQIPLEKRVENAVLKWWSVTVVRTPEIVRNGSGRCFFWMCQGGIRGVIFSNRTDR
jgi:hypothetical protein